jgi:uncharacterized protein with HEPN domain
MPPREIRALLGDAIDQIEDIDRKVSSSTLEALLRDRDLQAIFERRFEILGEVLRRIERVDATVFAQIEGARLAIDLRNFLAHGYDGIDHRILWATATLDLPAMGRDLTRLLSTMTDAESR